MSIIHPHGRGKLDMGMEETEYTAENVICETRIVGRVESRSIGCL